MIKHCVFAGIIGTAACAASFTPRVATMAATPAPSPASSQAPMPPPDQRVTYRYKTEVRVDTVGSHRQSGNLGEARGILDEGFGALELTFNGDGSINGTYKPDAGNFVSVTGARTGFKDFWLQIGVNHLTGQFTSTGFVLLCQVPPRDTRVMRLTATFAEPSRATPAPS